MKKELNYYMNKSLFISATNTDIGKTYACEKFLRYLKRSHTGEGKAVQSKCLEIQFQMSGLKIRDIVNTLRCEGHPICSDDGGYYYAANRTVDCQHLLGQLFLGQNCLVFNRTKIS